MRSQMILLIFGMAAVTYLTRFSFLYLFRYIKLPTSVSRAFRFIPIGILAAMIVPGILLPEGQLHIHWQNYYLLAAIASTAAALRFKNMFASLGAGLTVILLLNILF